MRWIAGILFAVACIAQGPNYNSVINRPLTSATGSPYFARGNNVHDDLPAITAALVAANQVYLPPGHFVIHGKLTAIFANGRQLIGAGASNTFLECTDTSVSACLEATGASSFANVLIQGITVNGRGKASGTNVHGIYSHDHVSNPYGLNIRDVQVSNFSGDGALILDAFDSHYENFWASHTGCYGIAIGGDQSTTFINSGQYNTDVGNNGCFSWWFMEGDPFLQGLNTDDTDNGIRFGSLVSDPRGIATARPTIIGLNVERVRAGGTGMEFDSGSNAAFGTGIKLYAFGAAGKGIYWKGSMNSPGLFVPAPAIVPGSGSGNSWANPYYSDGPGSPNHGVTLLVGGDDQTANFNTGITNQCSIIQVLANTAGQPNGFKTACPYVAPGFINSNATGTAGGPFTVGIPIKISVADTPYLVPATASVIEVDASGGNVQLNLKIVGAYTTGQQFIVKRTDTDAGAVHTVTVHPNSAYFDNILGGDKTLAGTAAGSLHSITFYASTGNNWYTQSTF